jgi:hypothetical protein
MLNSAASIEKALTKPECGPPCGHTISGTFPSTLGAKYIAEKDSETINGEFLNGFYAWTRKILKQTFITSSQIDFIPGPCGYICRSDFDKNVYVYLHCNIY